MLLAPPLLNRYVVKGVQVPLTHPVCSQNFSRNPYFLGIFCTKFSTDKICATPLNPIYLPSIPTLLPITTKGHFEPLVITSVKNIFDNIFIDLEQFYKVKSTLYFNL